METFSDPDYSGLDYFDSDNEFDDYLYFNELNDGDDEQPIILKKQLYSNMKLPMDIMKEILINSNIPTFIKLCNSSHDIRHLCDYNMWNLKFSQYNLIVNENPGNYYDWVKLYQKNMLVNKAMYKFLLWLPKGNKTFILDKELPNQQLIDILNELGAHKIRDKLGHMGGKQFNIYYGRLSDFDLSTNYIYIDHSYMISYEQLNELIYKLFYYGYLDVNKDYRM